MQLISVVIPLYNKALHIERTIRSVLNQSVTNYEVIVIDDGSTDGGGDLVLNFNDSRIRLIRQENRGVTGARNRGISEARGELIAFLDADDEWKPGFLEEILALRNSFPTAGAFATAYDLITPEGNLKKYPKRNILPNGLRRGLIPNYLRAALQYPVWISAFSAPKTILLEVGGFAYGRVLFEDVDVFLKISLIYPVAWSYQHLAIYYQNATNRMLGFVRCADEPPISRTARDAILSGKLSPEQVRDISEYAAIWQLMAARDCLLEGRRETALRLLNYSKGTKLFSRRWWKMRLGAALPGKLATRLWKIKHSFF